MAQIPTNVTKINKSAKDLKKLETEINTGKSKHTALPCVQKSSSPKKSK